MIVSIILFGLSRSFLALVLRYSSSTLLLAQRPFGGAGDDVPLTTIFFFHSQVAAYTAR
jgi:hypothetical protein